VKPGHLTLLELMRKMSQNPAALYHLPYQGIIEGAPADFVIFDPDEEWKVESFQSKAVNTPFKGLESDRPGALHHFAMER